MSIRRILVVLLLSVCLASLGCDSQESDNPLHLSIISGSENEHLEPLIQDFASRNNVRISMHFKGSVDMKLMLGQGRSFPYDAVWPANALWVELGDSEHVVKHVQSIMKSPVVFALKQSKARELGFVGTRVAMDDIMAAAKAGQLKFAMTSATQSNSGACAYLGMLNALLGNPATPMTETDLRDPEVQDRARQFLTLVNRGSGSSGWLKTFFRDNYEVLDGMFNYEAMIIEFNQWAARNGREPLHVVYPADGMVVADHPLGYVDKGDAAKEALFLKLQAYLKSPEVQQRIQSMGRRTGLVGLALDNPDPAVFNPGWGIDAAQEIASFPLPNRDVIALALDLFQGSLRKKSFTVYVLDYSGSMKGQGYEQLAGAMSTLFNYDTARQYMIQPTPGDIHVVIPFNSDVIDVWNATGDAPQVLRNLLDRVTGLQPGGGTDMYAALIQAVDILSRHHSELGEYLPAIILMTDGLSKGSFDAFREAMQGSGLLKTVPVYSIAFGDADPSQLQQVSDLTAGRYFDGRSGDLAQKFRDMKGYN